jgi:hypothetical protein
MVDEWFCQWVWVGEVGILITSKENGRHSTEADSNVFRFVHYLTLERICGLSMAVKPFGFEENVL